MEQSGSFIKYGRSKREQKLLEILKANAPKKAITGVLSRKIYYTIEASNEEYYKKAEKQIQNCKFEDLWRDIDSYGSDGYYHIKVEK